MKLKNLIPYAICVALLAAIVDLVTNLIQGTGFVTSSASLTFITFIAWASYFVVGANPKDAGRCFLGYLAGIISAILMFLLVTVFSGNGMNAALLAIPLAVFIVAIFMCLLEKVPGFNLVAAVFMGTGMYFGLMGIPDVAAQGYIMVGIGMLVYALIGLLAGWLTVQIRVAFEKWANRAPIIEQQPITKQQPTEDI